MTISFPFSNAVVLESGPFIGTENNRRAIRAKFLDDDKDEHLLVLLFDEDDDEQKRIWHFVKALGQRAVGLTLQVTGRFTFTPYDSVLTGTATNLMEVHLGRVTAVAPPDEQVLRSTVFVEGRLLSATASRTTSMSSTDLTWPRERTRMTEDTSRKRQWEEGQLD